MDELRVSSFAGLQTLPIRVASQQQFFAERGLRVSLTHTTGSATQLAQLARGEVDLIQTAPDNVLHFNATSAAPADAQAVGVPPHLVMVLGGSLGPLNLYARQDIARAADLGGRAIGVDNPASGFALVLRDLLRRSGGLRDSDYRVTLAGSTSARHTALVRGEIAATMLYLPYDLLAEHAGCTRLTSSSDHYAAYASLATACLDSWLAAHTRLVVQYISAMLQALRWMHDPTIFATLCQLIQTQDMPDHDASRAQRAATAFLDPRTGFGVDAPLDAAGLRQVLALRAAATGAPIPPGSPDADCDLRCYAQARASQLPA